MTIVEDKICDLDARGSEEADNIANERELDRFIITGDFVCFSNRYTFLFHVSGTLVFSKSLRYFLTCFSFLQGSLSLHLSSSPS